MQIRVIIMIMINSNDNTNHNTTSNNNNETKLIIGSLRSQDRTGPHGAAQAEHDAQITRPSRR